MAQETCTGLWHDSSEVHNSLVNLQHRCELFDGQQLLHQLPLTLVSITPQTLSLHFLHTEARPKKTLATAIGGRVCMCVQVLECMHM